MAGVDIRALTIVHLFSGRDSVFDEIRSIMTKLTISNMLYLHMKSILLTRECIVICKYNRDYKLYYDF